MLRCARSASQPSVVARLTHLVCFSAYFNLPISVQRVWVETTPDPYPFVPSEATPVTQTRRVHLIVTPLPVNGASTAPAPKVACIATSTVTITSPEAAKFFLDEKYPIGQTFRVLGRVAEFKLLEVSTSRAAQESGEVTRESLRRRYTLRTDGFECDIEVSLLTSILSSHSHFIMALGSVPRPFNVRCGDSLRVAGRVGAN
jgi:hypothetical protein